MIKRILVGLGCEPFSYVAIRTAVELAQLHAAELTAMAIVDAERLRNVGPVPIGASRAAQELRDYRVAEAQRIGEHQIARFEAACEAAAVKFTIRREAGDPFDLVISAARYHDLMVFGLKGLFEHGVVSEPPDELVRLVAEGVRPILAVSEQYRPVRSVVIAYSGSMESAKAMKRFVQLRPWPDVSLRIVTFEPSTGNAAELLADAADYCRAHGYQPEVEHVSAPARGQILSYAADWDDDLIVLGNSAKSLLRRRIFGEAALDTIRRADRPLFLSQ